MGMAASQARLLAITARIHDVEYAAQSIQAAKVQLATQEDQIYQDYMDALDATTLTINAVDPNSGTSSLIAATFNNLCSRNKVCSSNGTNYSYALIVGQGKDAGHLIVEDEIEEGYDIFTKDLGGEDAYQFAMFMIGGDNGVAIGNDDDFTSNVEKAERAVFDSLPENEKSQKLKDLYNKLLELTGSDDIYDTSNIVSDGNNDKMTEYEDTLAAFKKELYKKYSGQIYAKASEQSSDYDPEEDFNSSLFNYYVSIFQQIQYYGGCVSINDYNGILGNNGDAANNSDWLQNMIKSGLISIDAVKTTSDGKMEVNGISIDSNSALSYTTTSSIDKRALAKAEAEYEYELKKIDKKDKQFDLELSKLETERSALTTEYDSVKKVIEDNIERTFGIFS